MRRAAHEGLHSGVVKDYYPIQTVEAAILLKDLIRAPHDWDKHMRRYFFSWYGTTVTALSYFTTQDCSVDRLIRHLWLSSAQGRG